MDLAASVYKQDGTIQCEPEIKPRPLKVDADAIEAIGIRVIGGGQHERLPIFIPALCGSPTAWANVFSIALGGVTRQQLFQLSSLGFRMWSFAPERAANPALAGDEDPFPLDMAIAANLLGSDPHPDRIADLIGHTVRVYRTGDPIPKDYRRDRVNFETDPGSHRIVRYWFG
ncbi:hypothetical protein JQ557_02040 [Bradyrhizobium sp. U87765 SZCCT0131]|uniref:hypothetical protein n=1 Tax=unclassified Bradyrhizobium TaxID=2631580 RepID=UPI001BA5847E|nr:MULTISPECIES: hypothetical protein [unclassified Bradyrhizobium]MBR1216755.1 hypothetical protein [Bradyrhizobium sp. U87765 SZCCT0131]MBR1259489.1 hypothetical protein [Bradyrhizobium sp. U87765 SZCCT0134]MBR1305630.1 hypothetical protein [Bradyrhizobium sp. U87765 SZCCT0110]MBR1321997.1 hypothetical protein [Bradyrhizobium sp. U87765 SZCCT0109]MBR1350725.1 hypothetical protein [Bradyrhizobium sp. U87765 SZCCT0048]